MNFIKRKPKDKIWWVIQSEPIMDGQKMFSFDKKKIYYLFRDYPQALTKEEKAIFDNENPYWKDFFKSKAKRLGYED